MERIVFILLGLIAILGTPSSKKSASPGDQCYLAGGDAGRPCPDKKS